MFVYISSWTRRKESKREEESEMLDMGGYGYMQTDSEREKSRLALICNSLQ